MIQAMTSNEIIEHLSQETIDNLSLGLRDRFSSMKKDILKGRPFQIAKES